MKSKIYSLILGSVMIALCSVGYSQALNIKLSAERDKALKEIYKDTAHEIDGRVSAQMEYNLSCINECKAIQSTERCSDLKNMVKDTNNTKVVTYQEIANVMKTVTDCKSLVAGWAKIN